MNQITFTAEMAGKVIKGEKTVTRRMKKPEYKVGDVVEGVREGDTEGFAKVKVKRIDHELSIGEFIENQISDYMAGTGKLEDKLAEEAIREACSSWQNFLDYYESLNGKGSLEKECWRIQFKCIEVLE